MMTARRKADKFRLAFVRLIASGAPQLSAMQVLEIIEEECDVLRGKLIRARHEKYKMEGDRQCDEEPTSST